MFTRMMTCKLKPGSKEDFLEASRQLESAYKDQTGFVDLLTFISDEHPSRALVVAVWRTKSDSTEFYLNHAPLLDLKPFLEEHEIEHYHLEPARAFGIATGKAA
jgi:quinol monooxygenase YgiN